MNMPLIYGLSVLAAYLIGSISCSILIARVMQLPDPRSLGSGNPGTTNMLRTGSKKAAVITLLGDLLKGLIPILIARWIGFDLLILCLMALAAIIGHIFPVYYRFKGGKGVATTLGVFLAISWQLAICCVVIWICIAKITGYSSLAAILTIAFLPITAYFFNQPLIVIYLACFVAIVVIWRHQSNIKNLLSGKESRIGQKNN